MDKIYQSFFYQSLVIASYNYVVVPVYGESCTIYWVLVRKPVIWLLLQVQILNIFKFY